MKAILLVLTLCFTKLIYGQSFKDDWVNFSLKNWTIEFEIDCKPDSFLNKIPKGRLIFRNVEKTSTMVVFYVYKSLDMDRAFRKKVIDWYSIQSCLTFLNRKSGFPSFEYGDFYYLLKPCHSCNTENNKHCENLSELIKSRIFNKNQEKRTLEID